MLNKTRKWH